jgi:integrase/recombinase XerD
LFAGRFGNGHITRYTADEHLRNACKKADILGVSSHSYRRTTITSLHKNRVPIKVIMKISGHSHLNAVSHYIDTDELEVLEALKTRW